MRSRRNVLCLVVLTAIYFLTVVPVGMGLYAMKSWLGWNVSPLGGFHSLERCMAREWVAYESAISTVSSSIPVNH